MPKVDNRVITITENGNVIEKFISNLPNVRSYKGYLKGMWNLADYDDCFPKKNRLGDVDASVEQNGHTLHIEFKESYYSLTQGQILKAIRQAIYSNIVTFIVIGKTNNPVGYIKFTPDNLQPDLVECDKESFKDALREWSQYTLENNLVESKSAEWELTRKYFSKKED